MAIGERIHFFRLLRGMTQKYLGMALGFPEKSADVRLAQYETGSRTPKADLTAALAEVLDVSPHALSVPDIDSYVGLMHTLFTLEDNYGLKISEMDGEVCLKVDVRKNKDAARLHEMLCSWQQAAAMPVSYTHLAPLLTNVELLIIRSLADCVKCYMMERIKKTSLDFYKIEMSQAMKLYTTT